MAVHCSAAVTHGGGSDIGRAHSRACLGGFSEYAIGRVQAANKAASKAAKQSAKDVADGWVPPVPLKCLT